MSGNNSTTAALEWALRMVLASACVIHSVLDIACTGAKSRFLQVENSIPPWLLPLAGVLRAAAAFALFSDEPAVVLGALAYCAALWSGAVCFHVRRKHHPAAALPAGFFVALIFAIAALRIGVVAALAGTAACALAAIALARVLVAPAGGEEDQLLS